MEIENLFKEQQYIKPAEKQITNNQELEKQNPNVQQNIQTQVIKEAVQSPSSPTAQSIQLLAGSQAASNQQVLAQQQIKSGFLDIKI